MTAKCDVARCQNKAAAAVQFWNDQGKYLYCRWHSFDSRRDEYRWDSQRVKTIERLDVSYRS